LTIESNIVLVGRFFFIFQLIKCTHQKHTAADWTRQFGLIGVLSYFCLPSVRGSDLGALFGSKVAPSWILMLANSYGVYSNSINLVSFLCNNGVLELAP
jgi:hypothetical protein